MSKHHSFEEKLKYMKLLDEGYPLRQLSRETKSVRSRLYIWRKRYIYYGEEGLRRKVAHHVTESEIASIKADLMGKVLPLKDICIKHDVSEAAIYSWCNTEGKQKRPMAKRNNKAALTELEELRARNEYLEAENALLKKVKALVEARDARRKGTGQKPSSN